MKNNRLYKWIKDYLRNLSMSTQMILSVVAIFLFFFVLQLFLNYQFFQNYYADKEFAAIETDLAIYTSEMNKADADYYDLMYEFTSSNNAISVITTNSTFNLYGSVFTDYTIEVLDSDTSETYTVQIPNTDHEYTIDEYLSIEAFEFTDFILTPTTISSLSTAYTYNSGISCQDDCTTIISGSVTAINKPSNINFEFENSHLLQEELTLLKNGTRDFKDYAYDDGEETYYYYQTTISNQDVLVFIHNLGNYDLILTLIPIEDTATIISIVSSYNNYVYITAILIIFMWSFRLSRVLSTPIQNIENVSRQIADLNFDIEVHEYNNRENTSLSKSINLIARNLKETLDTLNHQNEELTQIYEEQSRQVSLKKQLVSSISHELKTPLMIMQATIQGILDGIIDESMQEKELLNVIDEINKSSLIIQDMLQIYRLEDANTQLELSEFNLTSVVDGLLKDFEYNIKKHQLLLDLSIAENTFIEADFKLIKRVISNFLTNAIKYTPERERIRIELYEADQAIYFNLINYGTQIKEEDIDNIWMPFYRAQDYSNNRLPSKGSGIGLYLVSEILKAHSADFGIENIENGVKAFFIIKKQAKFKI